jgi:phage virion morphogenesis protein
MSGVKLHIDIDDRRIQQVLSRLIETGQNLAPVMEDIATYGESSTRDRFKDGVGPDGTPWKQSQRVQERGGKTLIDRGHLLDSIVNNAGADFAEWGSTNAIYAAIHQAGGEIRPKNKPYLAFKLPGGGFRKVKKVTIPARPFLGINAEDEQNIIDIVINNINASLA